MTRYAYGGINLVAEYDGSNTLVAEYVYKSGQTDRPAEMKRGGQTFYYVYNGLGSVESLTNEDGQVVQRYEYDSFGRITLEEGRVGNVFTYTGREYDKETGLFYYRAQKIGGQIPH